MELTQLKYFQAAARCNHFTKAAAELHLTQSALSKSISQLENELGYQLFDRDGKKLQLNQYGQELLGFADQLSALYDEYQSRIAAMTDAESGEVSISLSYFDADPSAFVTCLKEFMQLHPGITLRKYQQNVDDIITAIRERRMDFGVSIFPVNSTGIRWEPLYTDRFGLQVSVNHPLSGKKSVRLEELSNERFVTASATPDLMDITQIFCSFGGFQPNVVFNSCNPLFNSELISQGRGIAFMSETRYRRIKGGKRGPIDRWSDLYTFVPIQDKTASITCGIFYSANRTLPPAASLLLAFLKDTLQEKLLP